MNLFEISEGQLQIQPEAYALRAFKVLWDRDKTKGKDKAIIELAFVYFMTDFKSDFTDVIEPFNRRARSRWGPSQLENTLTILKLCKRIRWI